MSKIIPDFITIAEGGRMTVRLSQGVPIGSVTFTLAEIRVFNAGDIMDAQEESERLVYTNDGMALVMSPARMARASLRRQVAKLLSDDGQKHDGPLLAEELNKFSADDLGRLQAAATLLDKAAELVATGAEQRGRTAAGGGEPPPAAGALAQKSGH